MIVADKKRDLILEKALARFAHFGVQKTTMNEIADDLAMSKPSVYYYFPDKISLVVAVIERIFGEYQEKLAVLFDRAATMQEALFSMLELRSDFLQKYFMLHLRDNHSEISLSHADIKKAITNIRHHEIQLIGAAFERAIKKDHLRVTDAEHTAELYLDMIAGISVCIMAKQEKQLLPDHTGFDEVLSKQKEITQLFLKGLSQDDRATD